jgi:hypothetical protein
MNVQEALQARELLSALTEATEQLVAHLYLKPAPLARVRQDMGDAAKLVADDFAQGVSRSSPRLIFHLSTLTGLCRRAYLGCDADPIRQFALPKIFQFFVCFEFPIDLDEPAVGVDDSFITDPMGFLQSAPP